MGVTGHTHLLFKTIQWRRVDAGRKRNENRNKILQKMKRVGMYSTNERGWALIEGGTLVTYPAGI